MAVCRNPTPVPKEASSAVTQPSPVEWKESEAKDASHCADMASQFSCSSPPVRPFLHTLETPDAGLTPRRRSHRSEPARAPFVNQSVPKPLFNGAKYSTSSLFQYLLRCHPPDVSDDASLWETAQAHQLSATAAYSALALPPSNVYDNSSPQLNIMNHCQTCSTTLSKPLRAPWDGRDNLSGASGTAKPRTVLESTGPQDPIAAKRDYLSPSLSAHKYRMRQFNPKHYVKHGSEKHSYAINEMNGDGVLRNGGGHRHRVQTSALTQPKKNVLPASKSANGAICPLPGAKHCNTSSEPVTKEVPRRMQATHGYAEERRSPSLDITSQKYPVSMAPCPTPQLSHFFRARQERKKTQFLCPPSNALNGVPCASSRPPSQPESYCPTVESRRLVQRPDTPCIYPCSNQSLRRFAGCSDARTDNSDCNQLQPVEFRHHQFPMSSCDTYCAQDEAANSLKDTVPFPLTTQNPWCCSSSPISPALRENFNLASFLYSTTPHLLRNYPKIVPESVTAEQRFFNCLGPAFKLSELGKSKLIASRSSRSTAHTNGEAQLDSAFPAHSSSGADTLCANRSLPREIEPSSIAMFTQTGLNRMASEWFFKIGETRQACLVSLLNSLGLFFPDRCFNPPCDAAAAQQKDPADSQQCTRRFAFKLSELWNAFYEPSCYGVECPFVTSSTGELRSIVFIPYLSALHLKRRLTPAVASSAPSTADIALKFTYTEAKPPHMRRPLAQLLQRLAAGVEVPVTLEQKKLLMESSVDELDKAHSWFSLYWVALHPKEGSGAAPPPSFLVYYSFKATDDLIVPKSGDLSSCTTLDTTAAPLNDQTLTTAQPPVCETSHRLDAPKIPPTAPPAFANTKHPATKAPPPAPQDIKLSGLTAATPQLVRFGVLPLHADVEAWGVMSATKQRQNVSTALAPNTLESSTVSAIRSMCAALRSWLTAQSISHPDYEFVCARLFNSLQTYRT